MIGSDGIGDPYYPKLGNGGYHARHYDVDLKVDPAGNRIRGATTMRAQAEEDLDTFNLDFRGLDVGAVRVNGQRATFTTSRPSFAGSARIGLRGPSPTSAGGEDGELTVRPAAPLKAGDDFEVQVTYRGTPQPTPSQALPEDVGWRAFRGGIAVVSEPDGTSTWLPVNDHPRDKATFTFRVDVPRGWNVAANGTLAHVIPNENRNTFVWEAHDPMAPYLATLQIGDYVRQDETGPNDLPIRNFFPPALADAGRFDFARQGEMIEHFASLFGNYPFETYGACVVPRNGVVGGALENQTLSVFDRFVISGDRRWENVIAHELAHQWFGDAVSVKNWRDLFLNEGFASYAEWLWLEKTDGPDAVRSEARGVYDWLKSMEDGAAPAEAPACVQKMLACVRGRDQQSTAGNLIEIGRPPANDLFNGQVYMKGALSLYALRIELGDEAFFRGIRTYVDRFKGKNAEIADFVHTMEETSGKPVQPWADTWLYATRLPDFPD